MNTPFQPTIGSEILFIKQFEFMIFLRLNGDDSFAHTRRETLNIVFGCHQYIVDSSKQIYLICLGNESRGSIQNMLSCILIQILSKFQEFLQNLLTYSPRIRQFKSVELVKTLFE